MISVLCVDDDLSYTTLAKEALEALGPITVTTAASAQEALRDLEKNRFDVIVADYQMPGMNGIDLLREVHSAHPGLPFILYTGNVQEEVIIEALNSGADFYLQKNGEPNIQFAEMKDAIFKAVETVELRKALYDSEIRYRRLFETAQDGILILDAESGVVIDANPFILALIGYPREEMLGKKLWEIGFIRDKMRAKQAATELQRTGYIRYDDLPLETKDGRVLEVEFVSNVYSAGNRNVIQCNIRDNTFHKRAEEAGRIDQAKFQVLFESVPLGITISDKAGNIVESNSMAEHLLGLPKKDQLSRQIDSREWKIIRPDGSPMPADEYASVRALKENCLVSNVEMGLVKGEGIITWIDVTAAPVPLEGYGVAITYSDITKRKQAEKEMIRSYERFTTVMDGIDALVYVVDMETYELLFINKYGKNVWGDIEGKVCWETIQTGLSGPCPFCTNDRLIDKEGNPTGVYRWEFRNTVTGRWYDCRDSAIRWLDGRLVRLEIATDITEHKKVEEELKESEERFKTILHSVQTGIIVIDADSHTIIDANQKSLDMIGGTQETVLGSVCHSFICPAELGRCPITDLAQTVDSSERILINAQKEKIPILKSVIPTTMGGKKVLIESFVNIAESKQAERALQESEERYRTVLENIPDLVLVHQKGVILYINPPATNLTGYTQDELIGKQMTDFIVPEYHSLVARTMSRRMDGKTIEPYEIEILTKSGVRRTLAVRGSLIKFSGSPASLNVLTDITERRQMEDALKKNEDLLRRTGELAKIGGWEIDADTLAVTWTEETYHIHEIPVGQMPPLEDAINFFHPDERKKLSDAIQRALTTGEGYDLELRFITAKGKQRWTRTFCEPEVVKGKTIRLIGTVQDITERKTAEEAIRTFSEGLERKVTERTSDLSDINIKLVTEMGIRLDAEKQLTKTVGEKEVLIREVHHRVKNNLQIIISLLNLQSRYITDNTTLSAFRESQNRIKAMALVHEKLYQSTDVSKIGLENYIKFLSDNLFSFFGMKGKGITLTRDVKDISLAIDTAIPVGLMINELISNSLKYAFPDARKGDISIAIHRQDHTITILFKDNGIGIPEDFDWRNAKSLGLRLVISLVEQLSGTIELDRAAGTTFKIVVQEKE